MENIRFFNFAYSLRYGGVSVGVLGQNQKNRSIFRGQIWELGGKAAFKDITTNTSKSGGETMFWVAGGVGGTRRDVLT